MRRFALVSVPAVVFLAGCNSLPWSRPAPSAAGVRVTSANPTAAELVAALNENARRVQSVESRSVVLECSQDRETYTLQGLLVCQPRQRNFRMAAKVVGSTEVDLGSNSQEFWFWIKRAPQPYLYHCSHEDFARGQAQMPFPFQPDWIVEAMGISEYDPARRYQVVAHQGVFDLVEDARSPQGQPVRKVTRFSRNGGQLQVSAHILQDANGRDICTANVRESQYDRAAGVVVPRQVILVWPAQQVRMKLTLDGLAVNRPVDASRAQTLFNRPSWPGVQTYDLARGPDAGGPVRRTGGTYR